MRPRERAAMFKKFDALAATGDYQEMALCLRGVARDPVSLKAIVQKYGASTDALVVGSITSVLGEVRADSQWEIVEELLMRLNYPVHPNILETCATAVQKCISLDRAWSGEQAPRGVFNLIKACVDD